MCSHSKESVNDKGAVIASEKQGRGLSEHGSHADNFEAGARALVLKWLLKQHHSF